MLEYITTFNDALGDNLAELFMMGVAMMYARRTIIPKFLVAFSFVFICQQQYFVGKYEDALSLYESGRLAYEQMMTSYNAIYIMGGLLCSCGAMILALIKPLQSKTGFVYCIALCVQALASIAMFANGLQVESNGELLINIPRFEVIESIHGLINSKMIIIGVVTAWISVVLSRKA